MRLTFLILVFLANTAEAAEWQGQRLSDYLDFLNEHGARILYSSDLVTDDMRLRENPGENSENTDLEPVLRPFRLRIQTGPYGSLLVVQAEPSGTDDITGSEPSADELPIPEIVVTSSLHRLDYARPDTHSYLDRKLFTRVPTVADEAVRLINRLPGIASGGVSAKNHVRGGEVNEVLFLFDGLRLYEPYHLKDFQAITTIINSSAIGGMDFFAGAYPVRYGDRMSGVLNIEMREPGKPIETEIALSVYNASILSMGIFGGERQGDWLVSARRGNLDLVIDLIDPEIGSPNYQDYLGHVGWEFGPKLQISGNFLVSEDKLSLFDVDRGESATASYSNQVLWLKWGAEWSESLRSDSIFAISDITDRRVGSVALPGVVSGNLTDSGDFSALELRQDWTWVVSESVMLRFGLNLKDLDADYRFSSMRTLEQPFDSILDNQPTTVRETVVNPAGAQYAAYSEIRWRPAGKLTIDMGIRWDQQNYTTAVDDKQYSPRASILYQPGKDTEIRMGWGQYHQAQEINELQISDGIDRYFPAQRAEHFVLNLKHNLSSGLNLDLSVYRKSFRTVRPRFENVFNTMTLLPELQFDRVVVHAAGAESVGAEFTLTHGDNDDDRFWWLGYTWSDITDEMPTGEVTRSWNQVHAVNAGVSWRLNAWNFSVAGQWHSGWPKTELGGNFVNLPGPGRNLELTLSDRNSLNYSSFHSLDARASRNFDVKRGTLTAFLEVTNIYNRANPCCVEYSLAADGSLASRETHWLPLVPSIGVIWRF